MGRETPLVSEGMLDYDARPASRIARLIGTRSSPAAYSIRDFLNRNAIAYDWVETDPDGGAAAAPELQGLDESRLPICILPDGRRLEAPTVDEIAAGLGLVSKAKLGEYDLVIVGAGPAGLAAAVYAASEGLRTVVVEGVAAGGQAGTSSLIENYLGFPQGISGADLAYLAKEQARRFGAELLLARTLVRVRPDGGMRLSELSDGSVIASRAVLAATGVEWRRLAAPGVDELLGAGVYYGAGPGEAVRYRGGSVTIVGGGNSAGQAARFFSRYAEEVTLLVRGPRVADRMSQYLVERIAVMDNIRVRTRSRVVGVEGNGRLRAVMVDEDGAAGPRALATDALFICIGGAPRSEWARDLDVLCDDSGFLLTGADVAPAGVSPAGWPLPRDPLPLETSIPGLFAAGDVRLGSTKRVSAAIGEGSMVVALIHRYLAEAGNA